VIDNYPEGESELLEVENNQENEEMGKRMVSFSRELYIERADFMEEPPKKYFRLFPGNEVRLKNAYFVTCTDYVKDESGKVVEVHCTYDPETRSGSGFEGRKVKGTIHWVDAATAVDATVRLYENLIQEEDEVLADDYSNLNPNSLVELTNCKLEAAFDEVEGIERFQFLRNGFFCIDSKDSTKEHLVFNRIVSLKSSYRPK
jgi:glutaminyl-tRNA synthetase